MRLRVIWHQIKLNRSSNSTRIGVIPSVPVGLQLRNGLYSYFLYRKMMIFKHEITRKHQLEVVLLPALQKGKCGLPSSCGVKASSPSSAQHPVPVTGPHPLQYDLGVHMGTAASSTANSSEITVASFSISPPNLLHH